MRDDFEFPLSLEPLHTIEDDVAGIVAAMTFISTGLRVSVEYMHAPSLKCWCVGYDPADGFLAAIRGSDAAMILIEKVYQRNLLSYDN
jgi:hypothetical protein